MTFTPLPYVFSYSISECALKFACISPTFIIDYYKKNTNMLLNKHEDVKILIITSSN